MRASQAAPSRAILIAVAALCSLAAATVKFDAVRIDIPGALSGWANAVTDDGRMVGSFQAEGGYALRGWKFDGSQISVYEFPGASETVADDISNTGVIVGSFVQLGQTFGFVEDAGVFTALSAPDATITYGSGVNDLGQVVGHAATADRSWAFLWDGGSYTTIEIPNAISYSANDINNHSQVVGAYWDTANQLRGYLYENGLVTPLDVPGAAYTVPTALNDEGNVVGTYYDADGVAWPFVYRNGRFDSVSAGDVARTLDVLGINNFGRVVGGIGTLTEYFAFHGDIKQLRRMSKASTSELPASPHPGVVQLHPGLR